MVDALITLLGGGRFSRSVGRTLRVFPIFTKSGAKLQLFFDIRK